jgi:hypothetical protein
MLYPLLQVPNREQDALGLGSGSVPLLAEAIGECLFLLRGLQLWRVAKRGLRRFPRHRTPRPLARQAPSSELWPRNMQAIFPTFAAICSMLYFGSSKLSRALNPCASSSG